MTNKKRTNPLIQGINLVGSLPLGTKVRIRTFRSNMLHAVAEGVIQEIENIYWKEHGGLATAKMKVVQFNNSDSNFIIIEEVDDGQSEHSKKSMEALTK